MDEVKPWYLSKAVWGGLVALLAAIIGIFNADLAAAVSGNSEEIISAGIALASAAGGAFAVYGRLKAKAKLTKKTE